jgi:hypothetical protein
VSLSAVTSCRSPRLQSLSSASLLRRPPCRSLRSRPGARRWLPSRSIVLRCRRLGRIRHLGALPSTVSASAWFRGRSTASTASSVTAWSCRVFLVTGSACAFGGSSRHATVPSVVYRPGCLNNVSHGPSQPLIPCHAAEIIARGKSVAQRHPTSKAHRRCETTCPSGPLSRQCGPNRRAERRRSIWDPVPTMARPPSRTVPRFGGKQRHQKRRLVKAAVKDASGGPPPDRRPHGKSRSGPPPLSRSATSPRWCRPCR